MFRFTIRDVLWLMVVVGLACGWWMQWRAGKHYQTKAANWETKAAVLKDVVEKATPLVITFQESSVHIDAKPPSSAK